MCQVLEYGEVIKGLFYTYVLLIQIAPLMLIGISDKYTPNMKKRKKGNTMFVFWK